MLSNEDEPRVRENCVVHAKSVQLFQRTIKNPLVWSAFNGMCYPIELPLDVVGKDAVISLDCPHWFAHLAPYLTFTQQIAAIVVPISTNDSMDGFV